MDIPSREDLPSEFDVLSWVLRKIESVAALIVVALFAIGVIDLGLLIVEKFRSGEIREVATVIEMIEFLLLLFIIVEVYRTIAAYAQDRQPKYVLTLVLYTGVIAVVRRILVFKPKDVGGGLEAMFNSLGFAILLLALGIMIFIIDQYGNPMETVPAIGSSDRNSEDDSGNAKEKDDESDDSKSNNEDSGNRTDEEDTRQD